MIQYSNSVSQSLNLLILIWYLLIGYYLFFQAIIFLLYSGMDIDIAILALQMMIQAFLKHNVLPKVGKPRQIFSFFFF